MNTVRDNMNTDRQHEPQTGVSPFSSMSETMAAWDYAQHGRLIVHPNVERHETGSIEGTN